MVSHLLLPLPQGLPSRRVSPGFGITPTRNPRQHGRALADQLRTFPIPSSRPTADGVDARFVFKIRSTAGLSDEETLERRELHVLGNDDDSTYFVLAGDGGRSFAAALERYSNGENFEGGRGELSSLYNKIDSIQMYGPADRSGPGIADLPSAGHVLIDLTLWPSEDMAGAVDRAALVELTLGELDGTVVAKSIFPRFSVIRGRIGAQNVPKLLELYVIEKARTPPVPFIDPSDWREADAEDLTESWTNSAPIGMLDDLPASQHPVLAGHVVIEDPAIEIGRAWEMPGQHGTMVAGIALTPGLAEDLRAGGDIRVQGQVVAIRVLEPEAPGAEQTRFPPEVLPAQLIDASIRKLHAERGIRIFNLSFGYGLDYPSAHVGELSEMLDSLASELNIVLIVAAGNTVIRLNGQTPSGHHVLNDYPTFVDHPLQGLAQPANAAIAVTVGGIADSDAPAERNPPQLGRRAVAPVGHLSPFSRTGPGHGKLPSRLNKPDLVAPGGNVVIDDTGMVDVRDLGTGVLSTASRDSGPLFHVGHGTSFAAPVVSRIAASILHEYPDASGNLVRALLASAANPPVGAQTATKEVRHNRYGFGTVSSSDALESRPQRVTMMFDGEMAVDTAVIHPVPIPREFALPRSSGRIIRVALAFDPPVRRTRQEYTAATMVTDAYRNVSLAQLQERLVQQTLEDPQPLFADRRRIKKFVPSHTAHKESTLQVKEWGPTTLLVDDGDVYYIVVTHKSRTWFRDRDDYQTQKYALTVSLVDETQVELDLPVSVAETVSIRARARNRA